MLLHTGFYVVKRHPSVGSCTIYRIRQRPGPLEPYAIKRSTCSYAIQVNLQAFSRTADRLGWNQMRSVIGLRPADAGSESQQRSLQLSIGSYNNISFSLTVYCHASKYGHVADLLNPDKRGYLLTRLWLLATPVGDDNGKSMADSVSDFETSSPPAISGVYGSRNRDSFWI